MKKIKIIFAMLAFVISANAQISFDAVLTNNYFPVAMGATKVKNSVMRQSATNFILIPKAVFGTPAITTSTATVLDVTGETVLRASATNTNTYVFKSQNTQGESLFSVLSTGAIYTGTVQAISSQTFVAGSNTITVTNGLITRIQ